MLMLEGLSLRLNAVLTLGACGYFFLQAPSCFGVSPPSIKASMLHSGASTHDNEQEAHQLVAPAQLRRQHCFVELNQHTPPSLGSLSQAW